MIMQAQQHHFNMPFQLACPGPDQHSDTCENATVYELELEPGDVVLLATDGVLDNMWDDQIAHVVHSSLGVSHSMLIYYHVVSVLLKPCRMVAAGSACLYVCWSVISDLAKRCLTACCKIIAESRGTMSRGTLLTNHTTAPGVQSFLHVQPACCLLLE